MANERIDEQSRPYSLLTLRPTNDADKKLFWKVCCEDVVAAFNIQMFFQIFFWIPNIGYYIKQPNDENT